MLNEHCWCQPDTFVLFVLMLWERGVLMTVLIDLFCTLLLLFMRNWLLVIVRLSAMVSVLYVLVVWMRERDSFKSFDWFDTHNNGNFSMTAHTIGLYSVSSLSGMFEQFYCCSYWDDLGNIVDSIAVSVLVVIMVDFDKYRNWGEQACLKYRS